jgi:hypothetical protein
MPLALDRGAGDRRREEESDMLNTKAVTDWTRDHHPAGEPGRVVFGEHGETPTACSFPADDIQAPAAPAVAERPVGLGPAGALARILIATMRRASAGPTHRECARANADLLLETIRAHSIL